MQRPALRAVAEQADAADEAFSRRHGDDAPGWTMATVFSTRIKRAYAPTDGLQSCPIDPAKLTKEAAYRSQIVKSAGIALDQLPKTTAAKEEIGQWSRFRYPRGYFLSPWSEAEVKEVAGTNPGYTFEQRHIAHGRHVISSSAMGTAIGLATDIWRASRAPTSGWGYGFVSIKTCYGSKKEISG